jgi:hypothetical protein
MPEGSATYAAPIIASAASGVRATMVSPIHRITVSVRWSFEYEYRHRYLFGMLHPVYILSKANGRSGAPAVGNEREGQLWQASIRVSML